MLLTDGKVECPMCTKRERKSDSIKLTYYAIVSGIEKNGVPPTVRELLDEVGVSSTSTIHVYIKALIDNGYISHSIGKARTIIINKNKEMRDNDVLG